MFRDASKELVDVLDRIFQYNPSNRISAEEVLRMPYFANVDFDSLKKCILIKVVIYRRLEFATAPEGGD